MGGHGRPTAAPYGLGCREQATVLEELDTGRSADLARVSEAVTSGGQRSRVWSRDERRLGVGRDAISLRCARVRDRLRQRQMEIDPIEEDLEHGRDDRGAAGRADDEERLPFAVHVVQRY